MCVASKNYLNGKILTAVKDNTTDWKVLAVDIKDPLSKYVNSTSTNIK